MDRGLPREPRGSTPRPDRIPRPRHEPEAAAHTAIAASDPPTDESSAGRIGAVIGRATGASREAGEFESRPERPRRSVAQFKGSAHATRPRFSREEGRAMSYLTLYALRRPASVRPARPGT